MVKHATRSLSLLLLLFFSFLFYSLSNLERAEGLLDPYVVSRLKARAFVRGPPGFSRY